MAVVTLRQNTFRVDLSNFDKRPGYEEIHNFIYNVIGLRPQQVTRLQMDHVQFCAHVKCTDLQTAQYAVQQHDGRHELEVDGKKYKIRLMMDDGTIDVKVYDLSENVSNNTIATFLQQYGEVHSIREIMWSDKFAFKAVPTGVRVAQMTLNSHIKSFVTIQSEQTLVTYRDQPQTCRHCTQLLHTGASCVENKKRLRQQANNGIPATETTSACTTAKTKTTNEKQQQQHRLQSKRIADRSENTTIRSPPRKKIDSTGTRNGTEMESNMDNEGTSDDNSDMETGSELEPLSEEEPPSEDTEKWIIWMKKKVNRSLQNNL